MDGDDLKEHLRKHMAGAQIALGVLQRVWALEQAVKSCPQGNLDSITARAKRFHNYVTSGDFDPPGMNPFEGS